MGAAPIYHICGREEWEARAGGRYGGSSQDAADGFIHFSTAAQVEASAARHRAGQSGLVLLAVDPEALGAALKWEPSRRGERFPHLYGALPLAALVFGLLGAPLGIRNHRAGNATGFGLAIAIIFLYFLLTNVMAIAAQGGLVPSYVASFLPVLIGLVTAIVLVQRRNR